MKRPKSTATGRAKKSVGFSMHNQTIEPPAEKYVDTNFGKIDKKLEFRVERAKEFESFRQIPKYSHA
jgi:hypothetical protein